MKRINTDVQSIMLTAYSIEDLTHQTLDRGTLEILRKPLEMLRFIKLIDEVQKLAH